MNLSIHALCCLAFTFMFSLFSFQGAVSRACALKIKQCKLVLSHDLAYAFASAKLFQKQKV